MEKKKWTKPELVVLVRGRPEEAILTGCRVSGSSATGGGTKVACSNRTSGGCTVNCSVSAPS